jgi:cytosine/adenosine deaminase-related metal-dependent hydrolase
MPRFTADWILPIATAPKRRGIVGTSGGLIVDVADERVGDAIDLGRVAVLPALVNAHTHLELSYQRGRIPASPSFGGWVRQVMAMRTQFPDPAATEIVDAARSALEQVRASGTALVGDVSNTLVTVPLLREAGVAGQVFYELLGFTEPNPTERVRQARERADALAGGDVRISLAPHAPYSVSAALFQAIRTDIDAHPSTVSSVHLGENSDETQLLRDGTGEFRAVLEELGRWPGDWRPPRVSPVAYLSDLGFLDRSVLAVHGVQFDGDDLSRLASFGMTIVSCPRSNDYVGVGAPPLEAFYAMDVEVAFGTDSLASAPDLNLFAELAAARRIAPRVPARRLLESATLVGARALRFDQDYGSIEVGKRAALIAVRIPEGVRDVEEYLVSGVEPEAVSWVAHE